MWVVDVQMHTFENVLDVCGSDLVPVEKVFAGDVDPAANDLKTVSSEVGCGTWRVTVRIL